MLGPGAVDTELASHNNDAIKDEVAASRAIASRWMPTLKTTEGVTARYAERA